ncbi:NAD(+) diphosphatase [Actinoplanes sp. NPDC051633]|uniref:NAD(+) diphosphatase n=1 Tax=Actinoplanes sp. NPDC051633 TaxID=3155670 RepID=UPI00341D3228
MSSAEQPDIEEQPGQWPTVPPLARNTLDRAAHHRRDPEWLEQAWKTGLVLVVDTAATGRAPVRDRADGSAELVLLESAVAPEGERLFLGVDPDGTPLFTVDAPLPEIEGARGRTLRDVGHRLDDRDAGLFSAAAALVNWHVSHLFSPLTGEPTEVIEAGWSRVTADGKQMWPRTDPAMIVLVHDGVPGPQGRCLLGRNAAWRMPDGSLRFSTLAGFVEPGESVEAAVLREVKEEVGITVRDLRYEGSQAWPYPGSLMLGFSARADSDEPIRVDPEEIAEARWFTRDDIAAMRGDRYRDPETGAPARLPMNASIALYLIERWLQSP